MSKTKSQKQEMVTNLTEKLGKAKSVVFADYQGMTMKQLSDLRDKLRDNQAEFSVTKNTLLEIALKQAALPSLDEIKTGPTATLIAYDDEISPIKLLVKALKDAQVGKIKAGFFGGDYLNADSITRLSALPSKDELRAKVVGSLASPLYGIVGVLNANLKNLVYVVDSIRRQKGGE